MKPLEEAHEDGRHVHRFHPDCARCAWERPAIQRLQEQVRYITGGKTIQPSKGWRAVEPPRYDLDEDLLLDGQFFDPGGSDGLDPWEAQE